MPDAETVDLFPEEAGVPDVTFVPLTWLPDNYSLVGPDPTGALVNSIKRLGVLCPVILEHDADAGAYAVKAGRRRVKAARRAGLQTIPAMVYPTGWAPDGLLSLSDHALRRPNTAQELRDLLALAATGASETDLAKATGIAVGRVRKVLKLRGLVPELRDLMDNGRVPETVAVEACTLPKEVQDALVEHYESAGRLTVADVREVRIERNRAALGLTLDGVLDAAMDGEAADDETPDPMRGPRLVAADLRNLVARAGREDLLPEIDALLERM